MTDVLDKAHVLIYSHDSFGLGHLRRSRAIAHALVDKFSGMRVLILSGSPIIGRFEFKARVNFATVPGIIKMRNGGYESLNNHIDLKDTLKVRESIIYEAARSFSPDIFIVDKEPLGVRGEVERTLEYCNSRNVKTVVGLRDVMDDAKVLKKEWERKGAVAALDKLYDEIWIYGTPNMGDPLKEAGVPQRVQRKSIHTGYLPRSLPPKDQATDHVDGPYILITPGGGGDGVYMVDAVLKAYAANKSELPRALFVLGPFMANKDQDRIQARVSELAQVDAIKFTSQPEFLLRDAQAVTAMGGYNTFCEALSFDKPMLVLPRTKPRKEQLIRATRAQSLGLISMQDIENDYCVDALHEALVGLPTQNPPSAANVSGLLSGFDVLAQRVQALIG
ncbi:MAG: glycosyltransferase family protein [Arenicellales bacterium WSBS_2016_MAG_OTU3]